MFRRLIIGMIAAWSLTSAADATAQPPPAPAPLDESLRGELGESCRARVDCKTGLKCIEQVCIDPLEGQTCGATSDCGARLRCIDKVCVKPGAAPAPVQPAPVEPAPVAPAPVAPAQPPSEPAPLTAPGPTPPTPASPTAEPSAPTAGAPPPGGDGAPAPLEPVDRDWMDFEVGEGIHAYGGLSFAPGVFLGLDYNSGQTTDAFASFMFSLRGGVMFGRTALEIELSPMTWVPVLDAGNTALNLNVSIGTYNELVDGVFWPTRFGVGMQYIEASSQTLFQSRLDLLGVAFNIGHVLIDIHVPSFRFTTEFDQVATFNWLFGVGGAYVF